MSEGRPKCKANVYDKYSEESRPCMRKVGPNSVYCWQHSSRVSRIYGTRIPRQGTQRGFSMKELSDG